MQNPGVNPSERSFSPETVCVPCTGVMIARAFNPSVPGTKAEVLALAVQMGAPNGVGANYTKLKPAMKARYGLIGTVTDHLGGPAAVAAVSAAVRRGVAAGQPVVVGLAGDQFNLTPRYQSNHVGHSIAVLYPHGAPGIQLDPLAPAGYMGDPFDGPELTKYATAAIIFETPAPAPPPPPPPPPPPAPKIYSQQEMDTAVAGVPKGFSQTDLDASRAAGIKAAADAAAATK